MIEPLLRLYPRGYRQECGEEILAVYRETAADSPPLGRFLEAADIAGHALRMRLGVSSATATGRLLARAAPFAAGVAAAGGGVHLSRWYAGVTTSPSPWWTWVSFDAWTALLLAQALVVIGAVTALTGRWRGGTVTVAAGLVGVAASAVVSGPAFGDPVVTPVAALLTAFVVLACPPDLAPGPGACAVAGAVAAAAWLPLTALFAKVLPVSTDYGVWPLLVLVVAGSALAWRSGASVLSQAAAVAVACPVFLAHAYASAWGRLLPVVAIAALVPLAALLVRAARALRSRSRSGHA